MTVSGGMVTTRRVAMEHPPGELLSPLKAIRPKCLDCCDGSVRQVALCPMRSCRVWPYRHAYSAANMQPTTVNRRAIELFDRPQVDARVQALREETAAHGILTRQEALEILTRIARGELSTYLDDDGHVDPWKVKALGGPDIQSFGTTGRKGAVSCRLQLHDPIRAIELIARMCGWDKQAVIVAERTIININIDGEEGPAPEGEEQTGRHLGPRAPEGRRFRTPDGRNRESFER